MAELKSGVVEEFFAAVREGDEERARKMLESHPALSSARDSAGVSALMLALYRRLAGLARMIAESREMDVWEAAATGTAPLDVAIDRGHTRLARILERKTRLGETP